MIREAIAKAAAREDFSEAEAAAVMAELMAGEATPAQVGALLTALRMKGECVDEIAGMARVMRDKALHVEVEGPLLDTAGTGGDGSDTFNVSTTAAFVCASAGVRVAKHGNRAASSASGSADVLEALGAKLELTPAQVKACIEETGFGFMFAQAFHPAMRFVGGPRREIGIRTIFNFLGPLTNPAAAQHQLLGVGDAALAPKLAEVLGRLGTRRAFVVHGEDGLDEVSLSGPTTLQELREGRVHAFSLAPEDVGLERASLADLKGGTPAENADRIHAIFTGAAGPDRDFVLINAAIGLLAAEQVESPPEGVKLAAEAIDSGAAALALAAFVAVTNSFDAPAEASR